MVEVTFTVSPRVRRIGAHPIASRVQNLAVSDAIFATSAVVEDPRSLGVLTQKGVAPVAKSTALRGIGNEVPVYELH